MTHPGDLISALLDGELTAPERRDVITHLEACAECRAERDAIAAVRTTLQGLPIVEPPPGLIPAARRTRQGLLQPVWGWAAAGMTALALTVGFAFGTASGPPPMDLDTMASQHTARVLVQPGFQTVRAVVEGP